MCVVATPHMVIVARCDPGEINWEAFMAGFQEEKQCECKGKEKVFKDR